MVYGLSVLELQLDLDNVAVRGRRAAIEAALRDAIRSGRLLAGSPLPSSRGLADDLGVSRSTIVAAYEQLTIEGFLVSRHGQGTRVAAANVVAEPADDTPILGPAPRWDLRPGEPDNSAFPRREWMRSLRRVLSEAPDAALSYPDPRGVPELRRTLAYHVTRTRSVVASPAAVFVTGGFAAALGFIADALRNQGHERVAVEAGMLPFHRATLRAAGLETDTISVDRHGIDVAELAATKARAVVVTPANQSTFGVTLTPERRTALVAWAEAVGGWIIEDDFDGEFRYDRRPIAAVQALAPDRVLYCGTASKALSAGLRLGWMVVPEPLRQPLVYAINSRAGVSTIDQLALADFMERGWFDRHVRTMRRRYQGRRADMVDRLDQHGPWLSVHAPAAGLHLVARLSNGRTEAQLLAAAADHQVGLVGLQTHLRVRGDEQAAIIGFSRPAEHEFATALDRLDAVLATLD